MKKLLTTTTVITTITLGFSIVAPAFAQSYNQSVINWTTQPNTKCYRIYYKETSASNWQHSVRCKDLPKTSYSYTIQYLKPNTPYTYDLRAVSNVNGKETSLGVKQMVTTTQN